MAGQMSRFVVLLLLGAAFGCADRPTSPLQAPPRADFDVSPADETGPPPHHDFGPDTYRIGIFTGQGSTRPRLDCTGSRADGRTCDGFLASSVDGTLLDVNVTTPAGSGPFPLVALMHGYAGSKNGSGDIAARLHAAGYAVLRYSTRGFGESWGQVNLVDEHAEIGDLRSMIGQVLDQGRLHLDPDAVAVTGASYGGGHSWLALLTPTFTTPKGRAVRIRTVVPIVPWTDLLYSLVPNGKPRESLDLPGALKLSFVNGLYIGGSREEPDRPYPNYPDYLIAWHAWLNAVEPTAIDPVYRQISDGLAGYRSIWFRDDFWSRIATNQIPIFQVQGFTDDLFPLPEALRMLLALKSIDPAYPIASYFGDVGHPRAQNRPGEVDYVLGLIQQWLAYYLKGEGTTPPAVIYANITRARGAAFSASDVITVPTWQVLASGTINRDFPGEALLVNPLTDPASGFFWDPFVLIGAGELRPYTEVPPAWPEISTSLASYEVPVAELAAGSNVLIAGQPAVRLHAVTPSHRVQLDVRLIDIAPNGARELITRGTYTLDSGTPGVPIGAADVVIPTYGNLWMAYADHRLRLEITNIDSPYLTPSRIPSATIVSNISLSIPVR